jgi:hypothetical protein
MWEWVVCIWPINAIQATKFLKHIPWIMLSIWLLSKSIDLMLGKDVILVKNR